MCWPCFKVYNATPWGHGKSRPFSQTWRLSVFSGHATLSEALSICPPVCLYTLVEKFKNEYRRRLNIRCEPPKTVAPPLTDQTTIMSGLCWVANYSLGLYKWRHQGVFVISTPISKYSIKSIILRTYKNSLFWHYYKLYFEFEEKIQKSLWWRHLYKYKHSFFTQNVLVI